MARMIKVAFAAIATLIMAGVMLAGGVPALAATYGQCTDTLVDQTSEKVLNSAKVESAVTAADKNGVDLYVRAFQTVPDGSLDAYWQDGVQKCANWRSGTGSDAKPKGNVALVAFSLDRKSAIFYGPVYDDSIGNDNANAIRTQMGSFFRNGDFTGGVTYAAERIGSLAAGNAAPVSQSDDQPAAAPVKDDGMLSATATIIFVAFIAALIVATIAFMYVLIMKRLRKRRAAQAALATAKRDALSARKTAGAYANTWYGEKLSLLESDIELELVVLPASRQAAHRQEAARVTSLLNQGLDDYAKVVNTDVTADGMTIRQYEQATANYMAVNARFDTAEAELSKFRQAAKADMNALDPARQQERIGTVSDRLDKLDAKLDGFTDAFSVRREKDFAASLRKGVDRTRVFVDTKTDPEKALEKIEADARGVESFANTVTAATADYDRLRDPLATMKSIVDKGRAKVRSYSDANDKAQVDLQQLEDSLRGRLRFFGPTQDRKTGLDVLDRVQSQVDTIVGRAKKDHDESERKRKRDREVDLPRRRSSSSRSSSSGSDAFGSGFAGGFLGGSLGSGFGSGGSSDSGGGWGGGSSGGFDGGSSSGGGDSGGW